MESVSLYPYRSGEYGLPLDGRGSCADFLRITGGSGRLTQAYFHSNEICLREANTRPLIKFYIMTASLDQNRLLHLNLFTKRKILWITRRHPDFFARDFVHFAFDYFERLGTPVEAFEGIWLKGSDNWVSFKEAYKKSRDKVFAASQTWSGRVMAELGFYPNDPQQIDPLLESPRRIKAVFSR